MARPRKGNAAELHTEHVGFYVTSAERAEIDRRAALVGRHVSAYCRTVLLSKLTAPLPSACDPAALNALLVEFSRQGNNLNQIAHHCNEHRVAPSQKVRRTWRRCSAPPSKKCWRYDSAYRGRHRMVLPLRAKDAI
jgi:Bacterial mobilisation protein (MobC)